MIVILPCQVNLNLAFYEVVETFLFGLPGFRMLAVVVIYLAPLDTCVPEVEQAFFDQIHVPASTRHFRLAALPVPHLELSDMHLGAKGNCSQADGYRVGFAGLQQAARFFKKAPGQEQRKKQIAELFLRTTCNNRDAVR